MRKFYTTLVFIAIFITGCDFNKESEKIPPKQIMMPPMPVAIVEAKKQDVDIVLSYPGKLESKQDVIVISKVSGTLLKQYAKDGDFVKKDDKLFLIDPAKYRAAYEASNSKVEVANANLIRSELDYKRATSLKKSNSISKREFDTIFSAYKVAKADLKSAQAGLLNSELDLNYTSVTAPFDGVLGSALKDEGAFISPNDPTLIRLTKLDPIVANFAISDTENTDILKKLNDKTWIKDKLIATINYDGIDYNGSVVFIDKIIDKLTGSLNAKAEFDNPKSDLLPGSFITVKISGFKQKDAFKIPTVAVQQGVAQPFVLVVKDDKVFKQDVKVTYQTADYSVISLGINEGDEIIVDNFKKIRVGSTVRKVKESE